MNAKVESSGSRFDGLKWLVVIALVSAGVVGNYYFAAESLLYRVLALLALGVVAILVALQTEKGKRFSVLMSEARIEIRKVVWPTRPELTQTTAIVVVFVLIVGLLLWLLDMAIGAIISSFIG